MENIAFCQSDQQVSWLKERPEYSENIARWISVNPSAYWALQKNRQPCINLEDFQYNKSSEEIESLQNGQLLWAKKTDEFLQERIPGFEASGFCPAKNFLFYIKIAWDSWIYYADLLESLAKTIHPDKVIFFSNSSRMDYSPDLTPGFSVLSECIPVWAEYHGIPVTVLPPITGDIIWQPQEQMQPGLVRKIASKLPPSLVAGARHAMHYSHGFSLSSLLFKDNKWGTILVRKSYDVNEDLLRNLRDYGYNLQSFDYAVSQIPGPGQNTKPLVPVLQDCWNEVTELDWFWKPSGWQRWPLRFGMESLFHQFWFQLVLELWSSFNASRIVLDGKNPLMVCVPSIWGTAETGFIMAAQKKRMPVVFYQHGACMGDIENAAWDLSDCNFSDYLLVYGNGPEKYIRSRSCRAGFTITPVPVGSSRLDTITHRPSPDRLRKIRESVCKDGKPLALYVPGVFYNNFFRYDYQDFRHCRIFDLRCRLAEVFKEHNEVRFAYKAFISHGHDPTIDMLDNVCPSCSIIGSIPLTELQWAADVIIHEIPGTAMYEGLMTDRPMIVYTDRDIYRMPPDVKSMLKKRVGFAETVNDLVALVDNYLNLGDFSPITNPDREFIRRYCAHSDDGRSASRAASAIDVIIKKWPEKPIDLWAENKPQP